MSRHTAAQNIADVAAASVTIAVLNNYLPAISALITIVWMLIRIAESYTFRRLFRLPPIKQDD